MANKKPTPKKKNQKLNPLMVAAVAVAALAVSIVFLAPKNNPAAKPGNDSQSSTASTGSAAKEAALNGNGDVVINTADITDEATFYEYDANGTTMGLFAVKASDGTIRTALNTCQVCNGSPYAFFEQQGDSFQCQNCGNLFSKDMIEQERGGCNPVPITGDEKTESDTQIVIPAKYLEENKDIFANWKKF